MANVSCVFCSIVAGDAPSSVVHEDDVSLAFMDLAPVSEGHTLIVPKAHYAGLEALPEDVGAHLWTVAHRIGRAVRRTSLRCEGVSLTLADGEAAGQEVFHVHLHVFPRYPGDSYRVHADWRQRERADLDATAALVRAALSG